MDIVPVKVEFCDIDNERGGTTPGVVTTCTECGHEVSSFGQQAKSVRRCLALLREECPIGEKNFYVAEKGEDKD